MKITADTTHPDYHDVVHFIDWILIDGVRMQNIVHADLEAGEATVFTQPLRADEEGFMVTHQVRGKITIVWKDPAISKNGIVGSGTISMFNNLRADWEAREATRKAANPTDVHQITDVEPK